MGVYVREQFSASRAARALYTHRNTVLNRLQRAERLLPLAGHGLEVVIALEIAPWLGPNPGRAADGGGNEDHQRAQGSMAVTAMTANSRVR